MNVLTQSRRLFVSRVIRLWAFFYSIKRFYSVSDGIQSKASAASNFERSSRSRGKRKRRRQNRSVIRWRNTHVFGQFGDCDECFNSPSGVAASDDGLTTWIADYETNKISVWSKQADASDPWQFQTSFGSEGAGESNFAVPMGIAVSHDGLRVWVADSSNSRFSVWSRESVDSTAWSNVGTFGEFGFAQDKFDKPLDIAICNDGELVFVADGPNSRISIWRRATYDDKIWSHESSFGTEDPGPEQMTYPASVTVSSDCLTAWVADSWADQIVVWGREDRESTAWIKRSMVGHFSGEDGHFNAYGVGDIEVAANGGKIWVADPFRNQVSVWVQPKNDFEEWPMECSFGQISNRPGQPELPYALAVSSDEKTVWVADRANSWISVWEEQRPKLSD